MTNYKHSYSQQIQKALQVVQELPIKAKVGERKPQRLNLPRKRRGVVEEKRQKWRTAMMTMKIMNPLQRAKVEGLNGRLTHLQLSEGAAVERRRNENIATYS